MGGSSLKDRAEYLSWCFRLFSDMIPFLHSTVVPHQRGAPLPVVNVVQKVPLRDLRVCGSRRPHRAGVDIHRADAVALGRWCMHQESLDSEDMNNGNNASPHTKGLPRWGTSRYGCDCGCCLDDDNSVFAHIPWFFLISLANGES